MINFHDQSRNQNLAYEGSISLPDYMLEEALENHDIDEFEIGRSYATMDLSSASDSISQTLASLVFPEWVMQIVDEYNPKYLKIKGQRRRRYIFQTSGNSTTFSLETVFFYAVAEVARKNYALFSGTPLKDVKPNSVYGDDIICDCRVFPTLQSHLETLGFTVNTDKSFYEGNFRESCGVEYMNGIPLHGNYWPRKEVLIQRKNKCKDEELTDLESMISLQHKLFFYEEAEQFLTDWITKRCQQLNLKLTTSGAGSEHQDLWDFSPVPVTKTAPMKKGAKGEISLDDLWVYTRECHSTLITQAGPAFGRKRQVTASDQERLEMYYYTQFLKFGPMYDDEHPLLRHLHITKSRVEIHRDLGNTRQWWTVQ